MKTIAHIMIAISIIIGLMTDSISITVSAAEKSELTSEQKFEKRMDLYKKIESITNVPWHFLAAVDTYERGLRRAMRDRPNEEEVIAIYYSDEEWSGSKLKQA